VSAPLPWLGTPLAQALRGARGHALLVHGPRGVGQFEFGLALASAWLCEGAPGERPAGLACGACSACHLIAARTHPDLLVLLPEALQEALGWLSDDEGEGAEPKAGKAKPSKEIKVDAVRRIVAFAQQTASRGALKVVLAWPAERINPTAANMLLKTLEEPPGATRFLLASAAPQRLLPTVRSRCQLLPLALPPADMAGAWLAAQGLERPEVLLAAAGGAPLEAAERAALGIDAAAWLRLPRELAAGQGATLAAWPLPLVIDALQKLCHDALCVAAGAAPRYFPADALPPAGELPRLAAAGRELLGAARHAEHPWNAPLGVEALVQRTRRALLPTATPPRTVGGGGPLATLGS
jgi:DNA polymerase-3 subunit delta'